jgi:sec-independent protein translocase protein TatB
VGLPAIAANRQGQYHEGMNLGFPEMIFLFFLALIIFGPKKLPEIGRQIGKALNEFKRASNEFKAQIEQEINQLDLENQRQTILPPVRSQLEPQPPAEPPPGAIPAHSSLPAAEPEFAALPEPSTVPDSSSLAKAPDA